MLLLIHYLGSASIAQVHKAKLLDGRVVAIKVQRPGIFIFESLLISNALLP